MNRAGLVKASLVCVLVSAAFANCTIEGLPASSGGPGEGGDGGGGGSGDTQGGSDANQAGGGNSGGKGGTGQVGGAGGAVAGDSSLGGLNSGSGGQGGEGGAPEPQGTTYDLKANWSNTNNPNGVWSLREGNNVITAVVQNWIGFQSQYAWAKAATGNGAVPAFLKVSSGDFEAPRAEVGDVVVHPQDEVSGAGLGQARIVWTAPTSGTVDVEGAVWLARTTLKRADEYTLTVAGVKKASGTIDFDDGNTRDDPHAFSANLLPVTSGDEVVLQISQHPGCEGEGSGSCAEFCGVRFTVKLTP